MVDTKWFQGEKQEAEPVVSSELEIVIDCAPNFLVLSKIKLLVLGLGKSLTIRNRVFAKVSRQLFGTSVQDMYW